MVLWVLMALVVVLGVKYYTSLQIRNLELRLNKVKDGLQGKQNELHQVMERQHEAEAEEYAQTERIRFMKEIIQDIHIRQQGQGGEEDAMVVDAMPPPPTMG